MAGKWMQIEVGGKAVDVYEPAKKPRFGILFLHGIGLETLVDNPVYTRLLDTMNLACICPHGGRSWWSDRLCSEFDTRIAAEPFLLAEIVPLFKSRWNIAPPAIGVLGISMGGQGALRLAFKHPKVFPAVAGISSALDYYELYGTGLAIDDMYDSRERCRQDTAIMHIPPLRFSAPHLVQYRSRRCRMAARERSFARETHRAGDPAYRRPEHRGRRALVGLFQSHGRASAAVPF